MDSALTRKLESFAPLDRVDKELLATVAERPRQLEGRTDIIREGDKPDNIRLIVEGFACRYKILPDGSRQIFAYLLPGDFCDLHVLILKEMDHSIATLSPCVVVDVPPETVFRLTERPVIARALLWASLVDEAILREWFVSLGRRDAEERVGHLFCELLMRLRVVGLANGDKYELPITQTELADTIGVSTVHANRVLQSLRGRELITFDAGTLTILDVKRLEQFSNFSPNYLHLGPQ